MGSCSNHQNEELEKTMHQVDQVAIVMVPFPAQGHLNQLLQLSSLLSSTGFPVLYLASAVHNRQARVRVNGLDHKDLARIQFHDLPTPSFTSPPPDPNNLNKFPAHLQPCWDIVWHMREPVAEILEDLSHKVRRIVVIHDPLVAMVVQDVAHISNAESYSFNCISAFCIFYIIWSYSGKPFKVELEPENLPSLEECMSSDILYLSGVQEPYLQLKSGELLNTSRVIEGNYVDLLAKEGIRGHHNHWAIGPILPTRLKGSDQQASSNREHKCLEWLQKQPPKSVLYISFGTTTSMSDEQIRELAKGLEKSKQRFIWVLRDADKGDVFDEKIRRPELPEGFEERIQEYGMVERGWAPQPEILGHPSTGGFMSHCGWNSCIESITMGVPIAAWPMHSDQPWNYILITQVLKTGMVVREWGERENVVSSSRISELVKRFMDSSEEGDLMRKRAEEIGEALRESTMEGGVSKKELDSFIAHITRS